MADVEANRAPALIATVVVLWVLSLVAVGARVWARHIGGTKLWWDDWLIFVAAAIYIPGAIADLVEAHFGAGKHIEVVVQRNPNDLVNFLKAIYSGEIFYPPIIVCIKCSILSLYYRLFGIRKGFARVCQALMGVTVAWGIATLLPAIFQCNPIRTAWDPMSTRSNCFQLRPYLVGTNVPNVLLDVAVLVTPLYAIWELRLPTARKVLISGIFVLGACETAFSIVRLVELTGLDTTDPTWNYFSPIIWSSIEISVGTICACLPVMAPLIPRLFQRQANLKEPYQPSSLRLTNKSRKTDEYKRQQFDRLDDSADSELKMDNPMSIRQTTDISINEERYEVPHAIA